MFSQKRMSIKESGDLPAPPVKQRRILPMVDSTGENKTFGMDMVPNTTSPIKPSFPVTHFATPLHNFYTMHPTSIFSYVSHFPPLHPNFEFGGWSTDPTFQYITSGSMMNYMPDFYVRETDATQELPTFTASICWSSMLIRRYIQKSTNSHMTSNFMQSVQAKWKEYNPTIVCGSKVSGTQNPMASGIGQRIPKRKSLVGEAFFPPEFFVETPSQSSTVPIGNEVGLNYIVTQQGETDVVRFVMGPVPDVDPLSKIISSPTYGASCIGFGIDEACDAIISAFDVI
ncbi:hypothetical protein GCK72_025865 [Caenorhabditis remanei]|uniref:Uncharacterized protein n=1 Tax=Caenorhabditis remanei TaxID=31234 RepID=A0A6A5G389_CAERE|nr:hypothetical protein GCK72_025865 [Caenorhabditis remanei]KAF1749397.1 hypothetical protein GCK72_025865 [Caenorhabditis remanei]